ncbi:hypothetical protein [Saccharolobus solfataricus]|uniref:Uncharacterized protein n=1 Tax=Saccharolobus solfataricus TaxID=2287 RepID=A0A157T1T1_SACSO|nr:hypothetical protein [Saccharolobus solfataricus]SAI84831.1 uncharacterised protein [Saccharolobus solfataricus]
MQGNDEKGSVKKARKIREMVYTISFLRPIPREIINSFFYTSSLEFSFRGVKINLILDERGGNFVKQIMFIGDESQKLVNDLLNFLKARYSLRLDEIVWSYEVYIEVEGDFNIAKVLQIPSVLPLIGSVTNCGIVITNDPDFKMMNRNFTTIQIDKYIRIIKRSQNFIDIISLLNELEKLLDKVKT